MSDPHNGVVGRVVVIEPMSSGIAVLPAARELGFETVAATYDRDDRCLSEEMRRHVDSLVVVETNDDDAVTEKVLALHAERPVVAIIPGFEFYVPIVARLADRLGLPGLPISSVDGVRNKVRMLDQIRQAGLRTPRDATVTVDSELPAAAAHTGFPCVAKPVDSAGSVHVS